MNKGRAALLATLTERQWQQQVIEWANRGGWRVFHVYDMTRSAGGFPDLVLVKPGKPVIYAELKTVNGRISLQQKVWLADLDSASGTVVRVWRPTDEEAVKSDLGLSVSFDSDASREPHREFEPDLLPVKTSLLDSGRVRAQRAPRVRRQATTG